MNELTKKTSLLATGLIFGAVVFTVVGTSAHQEERDGLKKTGRGGENVSQLLGISVDDLRAAKNDGQTLEQLVTANGFESLEAFKTAMEENFRAMLAEKGLSEEEIDEKVATRQDHRALREDIREARLSVLGLTHEQIREKKDSGMTYEEILVEAGYQDKDAFKIALSDALSQLWADEGVDQETIDERLETLENRRGHKGFGQKQSPRHGGLGR